MSPGLHFRPERKVRQELWDLWMESLPEKSVGGSLRRRGIPTFPANVGYSACF